MIHTESALAKSVPASPTTSETGSRVQQLGDLVQEAEKDYNYVRAQEVKGSTRINVW